MNNYKLNIDQNIIKSIKTIGFEYTVKKLEKNLESTKNRYHNSNKVMPQVLSNYSDHVHMRIQWLKKKHEDFSPMYITELLKQSGFIHKLDNKSQNLQYLKLVNKIIS